MVQLQSFTIIYGEFMHAGDGLFRDIIPALIPDYDPALLLFCDERPIDGASLTNFRVYAIGLMSAEMVLPRGLNLNRIEQLQLVIKDWAEIYKSPPELDGKGLRWKRGL